MILIKNNEGFFEYPIDNEHYKNLYENRLDNSRIGTIKKDGDFIHHKIYDKKYNVYEVTTTKKRTVFNKKFKTSCEKLIIDYPHLTKIKSLPKECICLEIKMVNNDIDLNSVSKKLISLSIHGWNYRFDGYDFSNLKKLQILNISSTSGFLNFSKLPKSIIYLNCRTTNVDLSDLDLKKYPNLKYISVMWDVKLSKSIIKAQKSGKITVNKRT
jgi:hypothetical protein